MEKHVVFCVEIPAIKHTYEFDTFEEMMQQFRYVKGLKERAYCYPVVNGIRQERYDWIK